ncbi:MAG: nitroreductase family protein [Promethearchaeota archaeon]
MEVKEAINKRRAYRSLESVEITDDLIKDLAESAKLAPSCMNNQPWKYIFVKNKEVLSKIFDTLPPTNAWVKKASLIIGVVSKPENDCILGERLYYLFDTGMATGFIILRATELGLVAHPIAGFNEDKVKEILNIPNEMRLITLVNVGKHSNEVNPVLSDNMKLGEKQRPPRKPLDEFAYLDRYENSF